MKALVLLMFCSGCFVLPKTTTTTRELGTEEGEITKSPPKAVALRGVSYGGAAISVTATATRECSRPIYQVSEVTKEKTAKWRGNKDARSALPALLLAPITIPVSAIATGVSVLADGSGTTTKQSKLLRTEKFECTSPASDVPFAMRLPSGATLTEKTGSDGTAYLRVPESEPYRGVVTIDGPTTVEVQYARAVPAVTAVRETLLACAATHKVAGPVRVEIGIDDRGRATRIGLDAGDGEFAQCVNQGLANARFSDAHRGAKLVLPFELPG